MSKYYHKNCSQTSQKEEAREETHMEKVWSYHNLYRGWTGGKYYLGSSILFCFLYV